MTLENDHKHIAFLLQKDKTKDVLSQTKPK